MYRNRCVSWGNVMAIFETTQYAPEHHAQAQALLREVQGMSAQSLHAGAFARARSLSGRVVTYSRKVFIPLTRLCRDQCGYCTFAARPVDVPAPYLSVEEVLAIAGAGRDAGCHEALLTLGDRPESRYHVAREALARMGFDSTVDYLVHVCDAIMRQTGLMPHVNAGILSKEEMQRLRAVSISQGIMLESTATRLCERGGPHFGAPDKRPEIRLAMIAEAGEQAIPFTSGILIGIGETRLERIDALLALRDLHRKYGHIQEIIVQNFRAKAETRMHGCAEPDLDDLLWTAAMARRIMDDEVSIQVPPNLSYAVFPRILESGISDWGGISPVTADHVNPEAPWPQVAQLARACREYGLELAQRLPIYPRYAQDLERWVDPALHAMVRRNMDAEGFARTDGWSPGLDVGLPAPAMGGNNVGRDLQCILGRAMHGDRLGHAEIVRLFQARGDEVEAVRIAADDLRRTTCGDVVRYVVTRNINYTNVCGLSCRFCAFSKGKTHEHLRGAPYDLALEEVARRAREAWERGATEVCMQGGISPDYTHQTYMQLLRTVRQAAPGLHVHAFSPLEIAHGARLAGVSLTTYLERLQEAGLGSLPGTAAEILDDGVRERLAPGKLGTRGWLEVVEAAHAVGLRTTSTIMFGHIESPHSWAAHLLHLRDLQGRTGGFTEFVCLPFVHMEAPMFLRGESRIGPTWREVVLMHAVARLVLNFSIPNIQASWVKLGAPGIGRLLSCGANDLGGTLMDESISRAAGAVHGQEFSPAQMEDVIMASGRLPQQRTTLYQAVHEERRACSMQARPLEARVQTPWKKRRDHF